MHQYKKLYTLLQMIALLGKAGSRYDVKRLARKFDTTERSIYRYLDLLKDCGFLVEKDDRHRYYIEKGEEFLMREGVYFSLEEAAAVKEAVLSIHSTNPLRNAILTKLFAHSELDATAELVYDRMVGKHIRQLNRAMKEQRQVMLKKYHSLSSNTIYDRLVEPIAFVQNMKYITAYEPEVGEMRQFKPDRIGEVELLESTMQHRDSHHTNHPDVFGMAGSPETEAVLQLSPRAIHLLREELPQAAAGIDEKRGHWRGTVKGFEGIGRFVMGLPGEVEVVAPEALKEYVKANSTLAGRLDEENSKKIIH